MLKRAGIALTLIAIAVPVAAQGPNPRPPLYGTHYEFERALAYRQVDDAFDKGTIALVSHVYKPLANDRDEVVVVLHGSTGGMAIDPAEPYLGPGPTPWFFVQRGYTVVVPMRRGRAESGGTYVEECPYQAGKCSLAEYRGLFDSGLTDAALSTEAVIRQVVMTQLKPRSKKVLLWGSSRGALLALRYAADHPEEVRGVVAVSTGWLSMTDKWPATENEARLALQKAELARIGAKYRGPTLWVYADRDPFYPEALTRELFAAFEAAGGAGRHVQVRDHALANGHVPPVELWSADAEQFLAKLDP